MASNVVCSSFKAHWENGVVGKKAQMMTRHVMNESVGDWIVHVHDFSSLSVFCFDSDVMLPVSRNLPID